MTHPLMQATFQGMVKQAAHMHVPLACVYAAPMQRLQSSWVLCRALTWVKAICSGDIICV